MGLTARDMLRDGRFQLGLWLRVFFIFSATSRIQTIWFEPFLEFAPHGGVSPWSAFLAGGGSPVAFPYGASYVAAFGPGVWLGKLLAGQYGAKVGLGLSVLFWDFALFDRLCAIAGRSLFRQVTTFYWLSPIVFYVGYWHGQLDVFPVALLVAALAALDGGKLNRGGVLYGAAVAAKLSMALPAFFIGLYLIARTKFRSVAAKPLLAAALIPLALTAPFALTSGFRRMVLQTPEADKTFALAIEISPGIAVYVLPMAYLGLLYGAWRIRKLDFDMLWTFTGIGFIAFLLLTPASPGWSLWALPFLALHAARSDVKARLLYWPFCLGFVSLHLLVSPGAVLFGHFDLTAPLGEALSSATRTKLSSVMLTLMVATGLAMTVQLVRAGIFQSRFRIATRRPLAIGIGGDSGAGKDTLVDSIVGMFGSENVAQLSGDDYHFWDRQKPMWRALTHLDPRANDLDTLAAHAASLIEGRSVRARHYDHSSGRMSKPVRIQPAEIVAVSGLHALWTPALNRLYDVRIFLDMDEDLRRFLKTQRDVRRRGYTSSSAARSIERRWPDSVRFIRPQAQFADVVLRLEPRHRSLLSDLDREISEARLRLIVIAAPGETFDHLSRLLTSLCGMKIVETPLENHRTEIVIEGEPTAEDIATAVARLAPDMLELIDLQPIWQPGLRGAMQLIMLDQLQKASRRRSAVA